MLHEVPVDKVGPHGQTMAKAIQTCVHCGFCLPACPTYKELGQEMDSPRGRIILMKDALEGKTPVEQVLPHLDACLGCLACEPACPSGVPYRDLISPFRARAEETRKRGIFDRLRRWSVSATLPYPKRFAVMARLAKFAKPFRKLAPKKMRAMLDLVPGKIPAKQPLAEVTPAVGERKARVALLTGCAQSVLEPGINAATVEVLTKNGVEVVIPPAQKCCGALSWHVGDLKSAKQFAQSNLDAFPDDVDWIVTNAAGCGSGLHEYGLILEGTEDHERGSAFAKRVRDVSQVLNEVGFANPPRLAEPTKVAYQDACHLRNAQGVHVEPRQLLGQVENLELVETADAAQCCGSAGTYNIDQPEIAASLGKQKIDAIAETGASTVVSGNIGCITQMKLHAEQRGLDLDIRHTMELLADAMEN
ncbi:MAG: glycolate oxidase iron-sulfur subunit [Verrucomicrobiales bacterium]|jgi:glycolate oxidase iron-sulfur subunit